MLFAPKKGLFQQNHVADDEISRRRFQEKGPAKILGKFYKMAELYIISAA
jgi:hypothetical protein